MTSSLLKLRAWLTLNEAADYLSSMTGLDVEEGDILRLTLDGQLQLSVNLLKPIAAIQDCEGAELEAHRKKVEGVWDLRLKGPVRLELENRYRATCGLPHIERDTYVEAFDKGPFVTGEEGVVYQLLSSWEEKGYAPKDISAFPVGTVLGVRRQALDAVVASLASPSLGPEEQQPSKPGDTTDTLDRPLKERGAGNALDHHRRTC